MSQETLSALLDGECSDRELEGLLQAMGGDPELKARWSRLQLARQALGGQLRRPTLDISAAVMARLGEAPEAGHPKVVELAARRRLPWRTAAGLAAAASVAAVAVTLGINFGSVKNAGTLAANDGAADTALAQPVALRDGSADVAGMDDDLRNYMIEHSNTLADRGVGGALSYARFAAHTGDEALLQPANLASGGTP